MWKMSESSSDRKKKKHPYFTMGKQWSYSSKKAKLRVGSPKW